MSRDDGFLAGLLARAAAAGPEHLDEAAGVCGDYAILQMASTHRIAERLRERGSSRLRRLSQAELEELAAEVLLEIQRAAGMLLPTREGAPS